MKIKTSELIGPALDWAVATIEGKEIYLNKDGGDFMCLGEFSLFRFAPTKYWAQGGPIIERERITVGYQGLSDDPPAPPEAYYIRTLFEDEEGWHQTGTTPLIAAMRCYVASKLGDEVDIPNELLKENNGKMY